MYTPRSKVRLILEVPKREGDGLGGFRLGWQQQGVLWAEMVSGSGRERGAEVGAESVVTWRITVRGARAGDPRRPAPGQRLRMGGRVFRIEAVAERDPAGKWLTCHAREEDQV